MGFFELGTVFCRGIALEPLRSTATPAQSYARNAGRAFGNTNGNGAAFALDEGHRIRPLKIQLKGAMMATVMTSPRSVSQVVFGAFSTVLETVSRAFQAGPVEALLHSSDADLARQGLRRQDVARFVMQGRLGY